MNTAAYLKPIVECLLFLSDAPLSVKKLREILEHAETEPIQQALDMLMQEYGQQRRGFELKEVGGGYQFRSRPEFKEYIKRLKKVQVSRLSKPALETLSIVAYKQPVMKAEIERLRGVDCSGVLRYLLENDLIRILGRKSVPGRPLIYGTTRRFLEMFDLKDLSELPTLEEFKKWEEDVGHDDAGTSAEGPG
jgi:segregation and condensation protein B